MASHFAFVQRALPAIVNACLTLKQTAALIGASSLSISHWEDPENPIKPRAKFVPAIAEYRKMGRREALARLEELGVS